MLIHGDASQALFYGASGCFLFSLSGRFRLVSLFRALRIRMAPLKISSRGFGSKSSGILMQEKMTAEQMNEAVANPNKSIVEAKA